MNELPLFPYQKAGVEFLLNAGSALLGDEPGLGKTIQSIGVCEARQAEKVLVFCPAAVKWQWAGEIERFLPGASVVVIEGTAILRKELWKKEARFYVVNYELLLRDMAHMSVRVWDIIIADEATKISNARAKQSRAIKKLQSKHRIALTGTPVSNRAEEVWNIIDFCRPGVLGGYWGFLQRYCVKNKWGAVSSYQNMDELRERIKPYMIRRLKKDVLTELPDKILTDVPFTLSDEERTLYNRLKKELLYEIEKEDISKMGQPMTIAYTMTKMLRLRQVCDSLELVGENKKSTKLEVLRELLQENVQNGRKAIIFTQFATMADILERELAGYGALKISGEVAGKYQDIVEEFNRDESKRILIMTSAGQYGLNIQRASILFHYDMEWSLAKMQQREGRAHRYGQKETVQVFSLLAKGTMDEYVQKVLHRKAELSDQLLGDTPITMSDVKSMLDYG